ncbi:MAG TPA: hypothetical protein VFJ30_18320 [Phycisphaerae bacterium]|nr:hypothetical protein [Phycisphaerae bacterium]
MTRTRHILAALAVAAAATAARADGPVTFARSGKPARVEIAAGVAGDVVLTALGRQWTDPAPAEQGVARISVPKVRAVTVFDVVAAVGQKKVGELVAWPDRDVAWGGRAAIIAAGEPKWFRQWADAVGLPVQWLEGDDAQKWHSTRPGGRSPALVVLGHGAAGHTPAPLLRPDGDAPPNVLVLNAWWFGALEPRGAIPFVWVTPASLTGPLSDMRGENWPKPLVFGLLGTPWPAVCNRRAWIEGNKGPLVEEVWAGASPRRVVLSYLRWEQRLGRDESADRLLLAVLSAAAVPPSDAPDARVVLPTGQKLDAEARPVLAAATAVGGKIPRRRSAPVLVVDLRGHAPPPPGAAGRLESLQRIVHAGSPLLILGDDPLLDGCQWLQIDRRGQRLAAAHVTWLADDDLPPAAPDRITLMQTLTAMNVSLGTDTRENTDEDQTDD